MKSFLHHSGKQLRSHSLKILPMKLHFFHILEHCGFRKIEIMYKSSLLIRHNLTTYSIVQYYQGQQAAGASGIQRSFYSFCADFSRIPELNESKGYFTIFNRTIKRSMSFYARVINSRGRWSCYALFASDDGLLVMRLHQAYL